MNESKIGLIKRLDEFIILFIAINVIDIIFNNIFLNESITYFVLELTITLILSLIVFIFKHNFISNIYSSIVLAIISTLAIVNLELYSASSDIFTFKYLYLSDEAASVLDIDFINPNYIAYILIVIIIYYFLLALINNKYKGGTYNYKKGIMNSLVIISSIFVIRGINYSIIENEYKDNYIYSNMSGSEIVIKSSTLVKRSSIKNFGLINYELADLTSLFVDTSEFGNFKEGNVNYSSSTSISGICKDYNIIEIMIETGTETVVDPILTPNLYNIMHQGLTCVNNYSKNKTNISEFIGISGSSYQNIKLYDSKLPQTLPRVLNKFNYSTSYYHSNYASFYNRGTLMPNLGFEKSYFTFSDESRSKSYDSSVNYINQFDWQNSYTARYPYDYDFLNCVIDEMIPSNSNKPFYSYWATLTTHGPWNYNNSLTEYYNEYYTILKEYESKGLWINRCKIYDETVQLQFAEYQCKMMIFDKALGILIDDLKEKGLYDNTLIILYGDHDPYYKIGLDKDLKYYIYNTESNYTQDSHLEYYAPEYKTILTFYNENLVNNIKENINNFNGFNINDNQELEYQYFTSPYVIVPTLLDILGIKYDTNTYVGTSIFQEVKYNGYDNVFYSTELNLVFTNNILSDSDTIKWKSNKVKESDIENFRKASNELLYKIDKFNSIYESKYYSTDTMYSKILSRFSYFN